MKDLHFLHPVFLAGENLTVRRGVQWATVEPGRYVNLCQTGGQPLDLHLAEITRVRVMRLCDVHDDDLACEQNPESRNYIGLCQAMSCAYPGISDQEIVTLVYFKLKD